MNWIDSKCMMFWAFVFSVGMGKRIGLYNRKQVKFNVMKVRYVFETYSDVIQMFWKVPSWQKSFNFEQCSLSPHVIIVDCTCKRVSDVGFWEYVRYMDKIWN